MKVEFYKCDVCNEEYNPINRPNIIYDVPFRGQCRSFVQVTAYDDYGDVMDVCHKCLMNALIKTFSEIKDENRKL